MAGVREGQLGAVVDRFYEAAAQPDLWRAALHEAAECAGGVGAILLPGPRAPIAAICSPALEEGMEVGMREGWYANNPRVDRGVPAVRHLGDIVTEQRIFSPRELEHLPFNAEFVRRFGLGSFAGMVLAPAGAASVFLSFERARTQEPFSQGELEAIGRALPHLQRAGHLALRLAGARAEGMLDAFGLLSCGGVLLDALGGVVRMNAQAERHLGRGLVLAQRQLAAQDPRMDPSLQRLVGSVCRPGAPHEHRPEPAVALPRPDRPALVVHGAPIAGAARELFQAAKAILMIVDPDDHPRPSAQVLRQAFGLSPAEARLAAELGEGHDVREIAARHAVSEGTVRAQLKALFAKTDTHRQGELVALIGRLSAPARRDPSP